MLKTFSRRNLLRGASAATGVALLPVSLAAAQGAAREPGGSGEVNVSPIRLGIASYTFRKFDRTQLVGFMKQLRISHLNLKDMHLAMGRRSR